MHRGCSISRGTVLFSTTSGLTHTATNCSTLQHATAHCDKLFDIVQHFVGFEDVRSLCVWERETQQGCRKALQYSATHCAALQCTATHCNTLQHTNSGILLTIYNTFVTHCNTLQHTEHTVTHCNTLQHTEHTATHCNTLQHTTIRTQWNRQLFGDHRSRPNDSSCSHQKQA